MPRILLVRHATSEPPTAGGPDDYSRPLSPRGLEQARQLASELSAANPRRLLSSPYLRARQTIEPAASRLDLVVETREELREWTSGLTVTEHWEAGYRNSWANPAQCHPGGESHTDLQERALRAVHVITADSSEGPTVIASHGTWIARAMQGLGIPVDADFWLSMPMPAVYDLQLDDSGVRAVSGPGLAGDTDRGAAEPRASAPVRATPRDAAAPRRAP